MTERTFKIVAIAAALALPAAAYAAAMVNSDGGCLFSSLSSLFGCGG